jgi:hypothetical protein
LSARLLEADERAAKAAIYGLNHAGGHTRELEEACIIQALVREDGMSQVEVAELLGRHKSWVCRRLALIERLGPQARDELRVGLLTPTAARQIVRLPEGNQAEVLGAIRREALSSAELTGVVDLWLGCAERRQPEYLLHHPREAYGPDVREIARHPLYGFGITGEKHGLPEHSPGRDHQQKYELLKERFAEFGPDGILFFEELIRTRRCGKNEAARVLGLLAIYHREDLARALERATRYRAFSWSVVERILAAQARPRSVRESREAQAQEQLDAILRQACLSARSTAEYQPLLEETATADEENTDENDD